MLSSLTATYKKLRVILSKYQSSVHDDDRIPTGTFGGGDPLSNRMEIRPLHGDPSSQACVGVNQTINNTTSPVTEICQGLVATQNMTPPGAEICMGEMVPQHLIPTNISKSTQLMLDQFDNNYRLFSQRLKNDDSNLTIRVVLLKNNLMFRNYTFNILGNSCIYIHNVLQTSGAHFKRLYAFMLA